MTPRLVLRSGQRLHDFTVGLTNTLPTRTTGPEKSPYDVCLVYHGAFPPTTLMLTCTNYARGRYLFIQINGTGSEFLTLCEVEVYLSASGTPISAWPSSSSLSAYVVNLLKQQVFVSSATATSTVHDTANVRITLRDGYCSDNNQVHVYTEEKPLYAGEFDGYFKRCQLTATERPADGATTVCSFSCGCTKRGCDYVTVRIFGRYGPIRSLCEVELRI
ncbi:hypothetical protein LSAT2_019294 [Lamellibrachia satsuma]|nr:hypothetical protein LSAT2_019294 [Lamellibrachia satsuma]